MMGIVEKPGNFEFLLRVREARRRRQGREGRKEARYCLVSVLRNTATGEERTLIRGKRGKGERVIV